MGLGKTFQVISLLTGLMQQRAIEQVWTCIQIDHISLVLVIFTFLIITTTCAQVLIIAPVSVLPNWIKELNQFLKPHIPTALISLLNSDLAKKKREQVDGMQQITHRFTIGCMD